MHSLKLGYAQANSQIEKVLFLFEEIRGKISDNIISDLAAMLPAELVENPILVDIPAPGTGAIRLCVVFGRNFKLFCSTVETLHDSLIHDFSSIALNLPPSGCLQQKLNTHTANWSAACHSKSDCAWRASATVAEKSEDPNNASTFGFARSSHRSEGIVTSKSNRSERQVLDFAVSDLYGSSSFF